MEEARIIAAAVMEHARYHPGLTLGVAAFSAVQRDAIDVCLEEIKRQTPELEDFFNAHPHEPFFVKSLENVQGDERDVIFISVGYGRDTDGRVLMTFGPLGAEGGERRLNVLITRARMRCEVFANITDEDINLGSTRSRGVRALKSFLHFARTGEFEAIDGSLGEPDSPFESSVRDALRDEGYEVHSQVGTAGFFIDLGVVHHDRPGTYILGIECDGASYHSARSARDRDRLRQAVLERLGWTIHRIWSTDWFSDPDGEIRRAVEAIERARDVRRLEPPPPFPLPQREDGNERVGGSGLPLLPASITVPYVLSSPQIRAVDNSLERVRFQERADAVLAVVKTEGPVHRKVIAWRLTAAAGLGRTGHRIERVVNETINTLLRHGQVTAHGDFVWPVGMIDPSLRDRSALDNRERSIDLIAPEEIEGVIVQVVAGSYGIEREEIAPRVAQLLGFGRTRAGIKDGIEAGIDRLLHSGLIEQRNDHLVVAEPA